MKKVLCFGDSNIYGYIPQTGKRYDKSIRWSGILQRISGGSFEIIEAGCNNRTGFVDNPDGIMQTGVQILPALLTEDLDGVIIAVGINDLQKFYNISFSDIKKGIEKLIKIVRTKCPSAVIIIAAPSVLTEDVLKGNFSFMFDEISIEKSHHLANIYSAGAKLNGCEFIDLNEIAKVSELDGLHYDSDAHRKIADAVFEKIKSVL